MRALRNYLYTGGRVVYKNLSEQVHHEKGKRLDLSPIYGHEITLSDQDYKEIKDLLESEDFLDAEGFPALWDGVSKMVFLTITYHRPKHPREFSIANYRYDHPDGSGFYAEPVARLLTKIESLRTSQK